MAATDTTSNFKFNLTDFDKIPWHTELHNNFHIMDALIARYIAISLIQGAWENALAVTVGDRYIDVDSDTIWEVLVAHTTPSTGTFAAARTATSSNWQSITVEVANKGAYAQSTVYNANDFIVDGGRFGIVAGPYTSDGTAATAALSYDIDVTAGDILTLLDASALIAATHDTNTVATGGTPTATYTASTNKFDFGLVTGATGATGATGPGSGTVTQINAGDGFSFSAITTTGTIAVDGNLQDLDALGIVASNSQMIVGTGSGAYAYESGSTLRTSIGISIGSDVQAYDSDTAKLDVDQTWAGAQRATVTAITSSSNSIAITLGASNDYSHTFTENTTLANPGDTAVAGQSGSLFLTQAAGANYTLAFGSEYDFAAGSAPTVTATNAARDRLDYVVRADGKIEITSLLNLS
jgi:hypothetical protein